VLLTLLTAATAALAPMQQVDTTFPVRAGQRLVVDGFGGDIEVKTWSRSAVRVEADPGPRTRLAIENSGSTVSLRTEGRRGPPANTDLIITVPVSMGLDLSGVNSSVKVVGVRAPITVETVQGDVDVEGGEGNVSLRSVQGEVTLKGAKGRIEVHSVNEDVTVTDASGEITAETVNGEIVLERVEASNLTATSVNGDVAYDGPIRNGGQYSLSSHNGDVTIAMSPSASALVTVSTFSGEFESDFPITLRETRKGRRFSFSLGGGGAQVSLESFQGTVRLARPGSVQESRQRDDDDDHDDH
jgi:hypothetical protein